MRNSRLFRAIGICQGDVLQTCDYLGSAQERIINAVESGDEGWWGTWAEMAFNITIASPFVTLPRGVTRIIDPAVCDQPVALQNQFYRFLRFGNGPRSFVNRTMGNMTVFDRGTVPTMVDLDATSEPQIIRIYSSEFDAGKRVLVQGLDANGQPVRSMDGYANVEGEFVVLATPFVDAAFRYKQITGLQKDVTNSPVDIRQADPTTAAEKTLVTMEPSEMVSGYRRYFVQNVPYNCCGTVEPSPCIGVLPPFSVQVSFVAKLDVLPLTADTDYLIIQNREALIAECQSVKFSERDGEDARKQEILKHKEAIRYLNGELFDKLGKTHPAINFAPFGSARLERIKIAMV